MSTIPVFLPYVNRPDMLDRMLGWIPRRLTTEPVVINNSGKPLDIRATVLEPPVPLTFTQAQNWMLAEAKRRNVPFYMWGHCDAILQPDTVDLLRERAMHECSAKTNWGVIYTFYDIFCAYSTSAMDAIGGYDTAFFDYCSDQDAYHRLDLAGYERLESHLPVGHDVGSTTINTEPWRKRLAGLQVPYRSNLYRAKWGGDPGHEVFREAWGGR